VAVVNPTMQQFQVPLEVEGLKLTGSGRVYEIAGPDPVAYNEPGKEPNVTIEETSLDGISGGLEVRPSSVSIYALPVK